MDLRSLRQALRAAQHSIPRLGGPEDNSSSRADQSPPARMHNTAAAEEQLRDSACPEKSAQQLAKLMQAGDAAARLGDHAAALQRYTAALHLDNSWAALPGATPGTADEGVPFPDASEASSRGRDARTVHGSQAQLRLKCAECCEQLGRLPDAVGHCGAALQSLQGPKRAAALLRRAVLLEALERCDAAARDAAETLALSPGNWQVRALCMHACMHVLVHVADNGGVGQWNRVMQSDVGRNERRHLPCWRACSACRGRLLWRCAMRGALTRTPMCRARCRG